MVMVKTWMKATKQGLVLAPAVLAAVAGLLDGMVFDWFGNQASGWFLLIGAMTALPLVLSLRGRKQRESEWCDAFTGLAERGDAMMTELMRADAGMAAAFDAIDARLAGRDEAVQHVSSSLTNVTAHLQMLIETVNNCGDDTGQHEASMAVDELVKAVEEIAHNAASAADSTHQALNESESGKVTMTNALGSMSSLTDHIGRAGQAVERLSQETMNIGAVLDVIRGIAEQTNLLALNAAIEAARAGEQGRGFAVVADEVRHLASRTQSSTQEIHDMIEALQSKANEAVTVMTEGTGQAGVVEEMLETATMSLAEIASYVQTIDGMNTTIASAAEQQSVAVQSIREVVHSNHSKSENAAQVVGELNNVMGQIEQLQSETAGQI